MTLHANAPVLSSVGVMDLMHKMKKKKMKIFLYIVYRDFMKKSYKELFILDVSSFSLLLPFPENLSMIC